MLRLIPSARPQPILPDFDIAIRALSIDRQTLAAMLEKGTPYPIQMGWGDYLLREAITREIKDVPYARRLITGGPAPQGYFISGKTLWGEIISEGVKAGQISLREALAKVDTDAPLLKGKVSPRQRQAQAVPV